MFDIKDWVQDVERMFSQISSRFPGSVRSKVISPPIAFDELPDLLRDLPAAGGDWLAELRDFYLMGAASLDCRYDIEWPFGSGSAPCDSEFELMVRFQGRFYGGPVFLHPSEIVSATDYVRMCSKECGIEGCGVWRAVVPFCWIQCGDWLAIDQSRPSDGGSVIYLDHETGKAIKICDSFFAFLALWREVVFIGPEIWMLERFGLLNNLASCREATLISRGLLGG